MAQSPGFVLWLSVVAVGSVGHSTGATVDQLVTVDLTNTNLSSIPSNYGKNITKLVLRNNSIELTAADRSTLANYSSLTELHLDNNLIRTLPARFFSVLPWLQVLSLSSNNISRVDPEAFSGLDKLTVLDLSHNLITSLPTDVFKGLTNLQVLSLSANSLQALDNRTFVDLKQLRSVDLQKNTWNCSCRPLQPLKRLISLQVQIGGPLALCAFPEDRTNQTILEASADCNTDPSGPTTPNPTLPSTTTGIPVLPTSSASTAQPTSSKQPATLSTTIVTTSQSTSTTKKDQHKAVAPDTSSSSSIPALGNTWKLLLGVLAVTLSISTAIVCAIKSPSWYKLLFNYRHQRLREHDEPAHIFTTGGRFSNYSLDTQQTEVSAYELEDTSSQRGDEDDEDGYIEDRYIDTADYRAGGRKYSSAATSEDIP